MKAVIVLGCEGHQVNGFEFCYGVKNIILDLEAIRATENYIRLIKYLDETVKIFDASCVKSHIVSNAIYKMYELGFIDDGLYARISNFSKFHGQCGLILELEPKAKK